MQAQTELGEAKRGTSTVRGTYSGRKTESTERKTHTHTHTEKRQATTKWGNLNGNFKCVSNGQITTITITTTKRQACTHTHTHTHAPIDKRRFVCLSVCVYVCLPFRSLPQQDLRSVTNQKRIPHRKTNKGDILLECVCRTFSIGIFQ